MVVEVVVILGDYVGNIRGSVRDTPSTYPAVIRVKPITDITTGTSSTFPSAI
jgi:hypothetical protein